MLMHFIFLVTNTQFTVPDHTDCVPAEWSAIFSVTRVFESSSIEYLVVTKNKNVLVFFIKLVYWLHLLLLNLRLILVINLSM